MLKNGLSKQQLKLPQIPPSDSPENSYQSLTPSKKSTLLHNKNALPPLLLSRESNSLGVGRGWRGDGGQLHPIPACFRACKYGETCTCSIGEYWAALQSYGGRPRIRSSSARSEFSRACECACVRVCVCVSRRSRSRDLPLEGEVTRSIWNYNYIEIN